MATARPYILGRRAVGVRLLERLKRIFSDPDAGCPPETSQTVLETRAEIQKHRVAKTVLQDKLDATGFVLGDAALARIDRRFLPHEQDGEAEGQSMSFERLDYWATLAGLNASAIFFLLMVGLIFKARRHVPADRWLAVTFGGFLLVCLVADVRYIGGHFRVAYLSSLAWLVVLLGIALASYHMRQELRELGRLRRAERRRLERLGK